METCSHTYETSALTISYNGEEIGNTIPLENVLDVAKEFNLHPKAIPINMVARGLPVFSVGDEIFIDMDDFKFMVEELGVTFCDMRK